VVPYSVRRLLLDFPRESQLAVSTGLKQLQLTAIVALLVPPALLAVIWRRPSGRVLAASQPGPGNGASAAGPEQVATPVAQTSPGHSGTAPGGPSCRRARWRLVGAAGVSLLCSLAVASCGSATPGSPRPKSTPAGTASPSATASGVDTRLLVQQGLSIGLASNVVQSQVTVLVDALLGSNSCSALSSGTGSSRVVQRSTAGSVTTADVDVYYDASCSQPYIVAAATLTTSSATQTITIDETATYYGPTNAALGVLELTEAVVETETSGVISRVAVSGTGRFTPHSGGPVVVLASEFR